MPAGEAQVHLVVRTGGLRVAVPMSALRSVVVAPPITRLPRSGPAVLGLVALAGELVAVAELAVLVGAARAAGSEELLAVIQDGEAQLALRVDAVEGHETLVPPASRQIDLSDSGTPPLSRMVTPLGRDGLFVLDVELALADPRLVPFDLVAAGESPL